LVNDFLLTVLEIKSERIQRFFSSILIVHNRRITLQLRHSTCHWFPFW